MKVRKSITELTTVPFSPIRTFGDSMKPFFQDGDLIYLQKTSFSKLEINDLVTYSYKNKLVTHRLIFISKKEEWAITKGDNVPHPDKKILANQIIGRVTKVSRKGQEFEPNQIYHLQSATYWSELVKVSTIFSDHNLHFVFLKGLPIHLYYEGRFPSRLYSDCDVLVTQSQREVVDELLTAGGYHLAKDEVKSLGNKTLAVSYHKLVDGVQIFLDVHFQPAFLMTKIVDLDPVYSKRLVEVFGEKLLAEKKMVKINGQKLPILSLENLIVYLSLHLFHHNFRGYNRYEILANLFQSKRINYTVLARIIIDYRFENFIYPVFWLLKNRYRLQFPQEFLKNITPNKKMMGTIKQEIRSIPIYEDERRLEGGVSRFKLIFKLSPHPFYRKILIFTNRQVISYLVLIYYKKALTLAHSFNNIFSG